MVAESVPLLVIITGLPASGKTSLGTWLAAQMQLPYIYKDGIKEILFESLGWSDRERSKQLGRATYPLLYHFVEAQLAARKACIVESNFDPHYASAEFQALQQRYPFEPLQIVCVADGHTLVERYRQRAEAGERHPGHVDASTYAEMEPLLRKGAIDPLDIGGTRIVVDTTDFSSIDYEGIAAAVRSLLGSR